MRYMHVICINSAVFAVFEASREKKKNIPLMWGCTIWDTERDTRGVDWSPMLIAIVNGRKFWTRVASTSTLLFEPQNCMLLISCILIVVFDLSWNSEPRATLVVSTLSWNNEPRAMLVLTSNPLVSNSECKTCFFRF